MTPADRTTLVDEASHQFTLAKHAAPCSNGLLCPWCAVDRWQTQANEDHTAHVAEMLHQRERATAEIDRLTALLHHVYESLKQGQRVVEQDWKDMRDVDMAYLAKQMKDGAK